MQESHVKRSRPVDRTHPEARSLGAVQLQYLLRRIGRWQRPAFARLDVQPRMSACDAGSDSGIPSHGLPRTAIDEDVSASPSLDAWSLAGMTTVVTVFYVTLRESVCPQVKAEAAETL